MHLAPRIGAKALDPVQHPALGQGGPLLRSAVAALPRDVTVLLIEHDMDLVFSFADRISVLVNGAMLVEGPPGEVARDPQVKAVYLGEAADA